MDSLERGRLTELMTNTTRILVLGATGKTGRRVLDRLDALNVPTRGGSRSGQPPFDWEDTATWLPALEGVSAVYISYFPDLAVPGAAETVESFANLAVENGVRRLVLLSGRGETEAERSEQAVRKSGAEWTILRCSWFHQNFSENYFVDGILTGELVLPVGEAIAEPFVDADDIADVAVAALTEEGHAGQLYEITGPRLLTFRDAITEIGLAVGREIGYATTTSAEYATALADAGVPGDVIGLLTYLFEEVLDGRNASLSDGVQRALGRAPRDFVDYARATAATGVWNPS